MVELSPRMLLKAVLRGLERPGVDVDLRLRSGDEMIAMQAAREIAAAGDEALREQREALAAAFESLDDEVRRRLKLGLQCLVAVVSGHTLAEVREWNEREIRNG